MVMKCYNFLSATTQPLSSGEFYREMQNTIAVLKDFLKNGHKYLTETNLLQLNYKKLESIE
jgi:hypothetical protein